MEGPEEDCVVSGELYSVHIPPPRSGICGTVVWLQTGTQA